MTPPEWHERPDRQVLYRGFEIASEFGQRCRPVHLLAALSELDGPIGLTLTPSDGRNLLPRPMKPAGARGGGSSYMCRQTQEAARDVAASQGFPVSPAHLLVAVIDQADIEAMALLERSGIDPAEVRTTALDEAGLPAGLEPIAIPALTPAGYMDRPILTEDELDPGAWAVLEWRQAHLPLEALRHPRDWDRLRHLEAATCRRLYQKLLLHADQELSLLGHHLRRVQEIAHRSRPEMVPPLPAPRQMGFASSPIWRVSRRRRWPPRALWFTRGWGSWFGNRWSGIKRRSAQLQMQIFRLS